MDSENGQRRGDQVYPAWQECCAYDFRHGELHFFYDAQNRPAVVVYNGTAYAYVKSLQGDIVAILDENGNTVVSYGYDAWGAPLWCTGELAETLGKVQPFRYRGYVFDEETGLYYLRSRYYNPQWGRFVNADGAIIQKNLFAYCSNGPIVGYDPSGFERVKLTPHRSDSSEKYPDSVMSVDLFVELIKQAVETEGWKYIYGHARWKETDCVGLPKYVLEWYYSHKSFKKLYQITKGENKGEILNQVKDLAVYGMQNGETFDITDWNDIPIGAAVLKYDPTNPEATKENKGWLHVGVYIGITEEYGYTIAAAASKKDGVGYFPLTDEYTKWGYFNGVWEWENRKYTIVDSKCLPQNSFLEKYHDGDSVLLDVGYITEGDDEPEELDDLTWLYFTIELNMQGEWSMRIRIA